MMKMSKGMQALQPEIEKLKKKYPEGDPQLQQEMFKLYREKGVNPANFLGCLPMFLQTPIWIALFAMLFLAIELRHQPAFYGVFQIISGYQWGFLADLSRPDHFIRFTDQPIALPLPLLGALDFSALNILPLLMGVMYFAQQKFMTPPAQNEQAAQQQKLMRIMVLLFPVFLYSAPSGLTLYMLASSTAGMVDSYFIRKHIREEEEAGTLLTKKPPKPGGLRDRIGKALAAKQEELMAKRAGLENGGGAGKPGVVDAGDRALRDAKPAKRRKRK